VILPSTPPEVITSSPFDSLGHLLVLLGCASSAADHQEIEQREHADDNEELLDARAGSAGAPAMSTKLNSPAPGARGST